MSLWYATQLLDFRLRRSSSLRHRELITRKGLYVRHSGQKTVNQILIHSPPTFRKVLNREKRCCFFSDGRCNELVDRYILSLGDFQHLAMERIRELQAQVAHWIPRFGPRP